MECVLAPLRTLIQLLCDSEMGFRKLSGGLRHEECVLLSLEESVVRAEYHRHLSEAAQAIWGETVEDGTVAGRLHRGWLDLEITLNLSDHVLLGTALQCENISLRGYEEALQALDELYPELRAMVEQQMRHVRRVHARLRYLREHIPSQVFQE